MSGTDPAPVAVKFASVTPLGAVLTVETVLHPWPEGAPPDKLRSFTAEYLGHKAVFQAKAGSTATVRVPSQPATIKEQSVERADDGSITGSTSREYQSGAFSVSREWLRAHDLRLANDVARQLTESLTESLNAYWIGRVEDVAQRVAQELTRRHRDETSALLDTVERMFCEPRRPTSGQDRTRS